ncbi:MAG: DUF504 domain-containing protein [Methanobacteriota archaeon]|nr:MAG: DUF504 domain-containing protein [Euryarchaeota archaeon]
MVRRVLNELLWHPERSLDDVSVTYIHRGAPGDVVTIGGWEIKRLERSFFVLERGGVETYIPYHRIVEVRRGAEVLYRKRGY